MSVSSNEPTVSSVSAPHDSPAGARYVCDSRAAAQEAIERAFDYRGDVTLEMRDGESIVGYIFNRDWSGPAPYVEVYVKGISDPVRLDCVDVAAVAFTGTDTAAGKSWEHWLETVEKAERDGQIAELYPEKLD